MPMNVAKIFWLDTLHEYKIDHMLPLPYDRYRLSDEHATGHGRSVSFNFDEDLSYHFLAYSSSNNITLQQLAITSYYAFLFKLANGEKDLCIGMNTHGRYKEELKSVIGVFINTIPLRCQLEPYQSFQEFVEHVQMVTTSCLEYSYFPLQHIFAQHATTTTKLAFLNTLFDFHTTENGNSKNEVMIGSSRLHTVPILFKNSEDKIICNVDFSLTVQHDLNTNQLSCVISASLDLFNVETVNKIAQRYHSILKQLFTPNDNHMNKPVDELSLILPDERLLMQSMNNIQVSRPFVSCIHHEFVCHVMKHPQKIAIELDEQSLTYCELLHYVQLLALNLVNKNGVVVGDIICQCVQRSVSMVR